MSFESIEGSAHDATALRLYDFQRGPLHWRYTNADRDRVYQSNTYSAIAISDDGKTESGEAAQETFNITAPAGFEIAEQFKVVAPSQKIVVTVLDLHDGDDAAEVFWTGEVSSVQRPATGVKLVCESILSAMQVLGLSIAWQRQCPYTTYDENCGASKIAQRVPATITSLDGITVHGAAFAGKPDNFFAGGSLEWSTPQGLAERRMIIGHTGDALTLLGSTFGLAVGMAIDAYPVCDFTPAGCAKINDPANFGGVPGLPGKSPFVNSPFA